jgi:hypothetical protein
LPQDLVTFLTGLDLCVNSENNEWILCRSDYEGVSGGAFAWNEFESMSLDAAGDNAQLIARIVAFWTCHFPFYMSVAGAYEFCAVRVCGDDFGVVVQGSEPEFEEVSVVALSFRDFIIGVARTGSRKHAMD